MLSGLLDISPLIIETISFVANTLYDLKQLTTGISLFVILHYHIPSMCLIQIEFTISIFKKNDGFNFKRFVKNL